MANFTTRKDTVNPSMKVAYLCNPHVGGTFTFFRRLRPAIGPMGIDLRCVGVDSSEAGSLSPQDLDGVDMVEVSQDAAKANATLVQMLQQRGFDVVMCLSGNSVLMVNSLRYLPREIRTVARLGSMTRGAYAPAQSISFHCDRFVAVSDRIKKDLVDHWGISPARISTICNGVEPHAVAEAADCRVDTSAFRLVSVGRLSDQDKGVLGLPHILKQVVREYPRTRLEVLGEGPSRIELENRFQSMGLQDHVNIRGAVGGPEISECLRTCHVFVMLSRFEGCPNALLEAMAEGCVPVVYRIKDCTDVIVTDHVSGRVVEMGDAREFSCALVDLARDRDTWREMSRKAVERIRDRFLLHATATAYAQLFQELVSNPSIRTTPVSCDQYSIPSGLQRTWRTCVPQPVKNLVRTWCERWGVSV